MLRKNLDRVDYNGLTLALIEETLSDGSKAYTMEFPEEKMSYSKPSVVDKPTPQVEKSGGAIKKRSKSTKHTW